MTRPCACLDPRVFGHIWPCAPLFPERNYGTGELEYWFPPNTPPGGQPRKLTRAEALAEATASLRRTR